MTDYLIRIPTRHRQSSAFSLPGAFVAAMLFSSQCLAQPAAADLFDIELADLATLKVRIASTEPERIIDTQAIVTGYDTRQMQNMGLNTLEDLLNFVPSVVVQDTAIGTKAVMMRGIVEAFNQKG